MEQQILQSMVANPADIEKFLELVPAQVWSKQAQEIIPTIQALNEKKSLTLETLSAHVSEEVRNSEYFITMLARPYVFDYIALAPQLVKNYQLHAQQEIGSALIRASTSGTLIDIDTLRDKVSFSNTSPLTVAQWSEYYKSRPQQEQLKSGISFLDNCFNNGFEVGQLVLISGDPEAGKTMLGLQILEHIAQREKAVFFCFEFTVEQYIRRRFADIDNSTLANNMLVINDGYDIHEIARTIKALHKQGARCFLIDSQMRITSPSARNMEEEESLKFSTLAKLCHSLGILVFLIIQTAKGDRDNPMGSKKGAHEASVIIRIERCSPEKDDILQAGNEYDENKRIVLIRKNKQTGKHFKEKVNFCPKKLRFSEDKINYEALDVYKI